jgi:hypothetical protein
MSAAHRLCYTREYNSLNAYYLENFIRQWFDLTPWHPEDRSQDPLLFGAPFDCDTVIDAARQGRKIIVDNLQDYAVPDLIKLRPWSEQVLIMTAGSQNYHPDFTLVNVFEWFWYFESLWYHDRGYSSYRPCPQRHRRKFLMPIRLQKPVRDRVVSLLGDQLDDAVWSYQARGRHLPGVPDQDRDDQRWFEPNWYDSTWFSLVNESYVYDDYICWSEKTSKPLAFFHPFLIIASAGHLAKIREWGFETFPEVFDETYDQLPGISQRLSRVVEQVQEFDPKRVDQPVVQAKLRHNHERFFNTDLVFDNLTNRLVKPMLEFLETPI